MKKTRWKNIIRDIRQSLNRFLSILFIVALGAGFMAGLAAASPDMYEAADRYIDDYNLFDLDVKSLIGLTEEDLAKLSETNRVNTVQEARVFDMVLEQAGGSDFTSRVYGMLDEEGNTALNQLNLVEGTLPGSPEECIVESIFGRYSGESVSIGDTLTLAKQNTNYSTLEEYMTTTTLTIVGICQSPMSISIEGDSTNIGSGTINLNVYTRKDLFDCDFYTDAFLSLDGSKTFDTFRSDYEDYVDAVIAEIKTYGSDRASERKEALQQELLDDEKILEQMITRFEAIGDIEAQLAASAAKGIATLEKIPGQWLKAKGSEENSIAFSSVSDWLENAYDQRSQLESAISSLDNSTWIYRTRNDLAGFESYNTNVGKVSALAKIFPVFFFIVALLVALTTMSRLIEEKRLQIGTLKAMGFSNANILFEFMLFSTLASVLGCLVGFGIGFHIFPTAINSAYSMMYVLPPIQTPIRWDIVAWVAPVTIGSILLASLWSCWNEFRSVPAILMQPKSPPAGKRIWLEHIGFLWNRLSFTHKVTCRNLFRYKKRFVMTIIGVAGCSALLLTGFGIKDSVNEIVDKQFGEIYRYNALFAVDEYPSIEEDPQIRDVLNDSFLVTSHTAACQETGKLHADHSSQEIVLFIPEDPSVLPEFICLRSRKTSEEYFLHSGEVILTEKICEEMNIRPGDTVTLENSHGISREVTVQAIAENYVSSFAYMTPDTYRQLFGSLPDYTSLLCISPSDITTKMLESPHVLYGRSVSSLKTTFSDSIQSINGVIYVLILAAGLLCIVVLYNLTNVNICERRKELATLRVLGFFPHETQNYIFRETNILSFLGSLTGLLIGIWLHSFVVKTVEVNHIMFGRDIKPLSYLYALAISIGFTYIVDLIMKRPINRTDMVEAMKAND